MEFYQELIQLDRFDSNWKDIERKGKQTLKELKSIATARSVGSSTRIEGSKLSDTEVGVLIENLDISKLTDRDQQEVAGYYKTLNLIAESYRDIAITESNIKYLHKTLMSFSKKDDHHKGDYKTTSNRVEKTEADGTKTIIFNTTAPGLATRETMEKVVHWYNNDNTTPAIIRAAIFVYEFLSIHPFEDGNGRLSRLLANLLLLKSGYAWIEYVSFEHEIEHRKKEYYQVLMNAQRNRPGEDVTEWVNFFIACLKNIQQQLLEKVKKKDYLDSIGMREQSIYNLIENNPGISSGDIASKLDIPNPTVKRILADLKKMGALVVHGAGRGTSYSIDIRDHINRNVTLRLTNEDRIKELLLTQIGTFVCIKKIILTPHFEWKHPDEWVKKLSNNGLIITIQAITGKGKVFRKSYSVFGFNDPNYYQPVLIVSPNIILPDILEANGISKIDFPIKCQIELSGSVEKFDFDVMLVMDEG